MFDDLEDDELEMIDSKELDEEEEKDRLKRTASKKRTVGEVGKYSCFICAVVYMFIIYIQCSFELVLCVFV